MSLGKKDEAITLATIARGEAPQLFQEEFARVLANIADGRTPPRAVRRISLEFTFQPDLERHSIDVQVEASSKLAKVAREPGLMYATLTDEGIKATAHDVKQPLLGEEPKKARRGRLKVGETVSGGPIKRGEDDWPADAHPKATVDLEQRDRARRAKAGKEPTPVQSKRSTPRRIDWEKKKVHAAESALRPNPILSLDENS